MTPLCNRITAYLQNHSNGMSRCELEKIMDEKIPVEIMRDLVDSGKLEMHMGFAVDGLVFIYRRRVT